MVDVKSPDLPTPPPDSPALEIVPIDIYELKSGQYNTANVYVPWSLKPLAATASAANAATATTTTVGVFSITQEFFEHGLTEGVRAWLKHECLLRSIEFRVSVPFVSTLEADWPRKETANAGVGGGAGGSGWYEFWWSFYDRYVSQFDFERWCLNVQERWMAHKPVCLSLSEKWQKQLSALAFKRLQRALNAPLKPKEIAEWADHPLAEQIQVAINTDFKTSRAVFVKLSRTSGKNERSCRPCETWADVLQTLTNNKVMCGEYMRLSPSTTLVLQPWAPKLRPETEWRVFVKCGRVSAITQQRAKACFNHTRESVTAIAQGIVALVKSMSTAWTELGFSIAVLDVWYDGTTVHLIEINPWVSSGTGLFDWSADRDKLERHPSATATATATHTTLLTSVVHVRYGVQSSVADA